MEGNAPRTLHRHSGNLQTSAGYQRGTTRPRMRAVEPDAQESGRRSHTATARQGWKGMHRAPSGIPDTSTTRHHSAEIETAGHLHPSEGIRATARPPIGAAEVDGHGTSTGKNKRSGYFRLAYFGSVNFISIYTLFTPCNVEVIDIQLGFDSPRRYIGERPASMDAGLSHL